MTRSRLHPRAFILALVPALLAIAGSRAVHAQTGMSSDTRSIANPSASFAPAAQTRAPFCFRGRALPRCRAFLLTEVGYYQRAVSTEQLYPDSERSRSIPELDSHLSWDVGYMKNLDRSKAVGGTVMLGTGDAGIRAAAKARHRWWISNDLAGGDGTVDLSLGVLSAGLRSPGTAPADNPGTGFSYVTRGVGLTGEATLGYGDYIGVSVRAEVLRANGRTATAAFGGVRLGSYPAVAASTIGALGLVLLIRSLSPGS